MHTKLQELPRDDLYSLLSPIPSHPLEERDFTDGYCDCGIVVNHRDCGSATAKLKSQINVPQDVKDVKPSHSLYSITGFVVAFVVITVGRFRLGMGGEMARTLPLPSSVGITLRSPTRMETCIRAGYVIVLGLTSASVQRILRLNVVGKLVVLARFLSLGDCLLRCHQWVVMMQSK